MKSSKTIIFKLKFSITLYQPIVICEELIIQTNKRY